MKPRASQNKAPWQRGEAARPARSRGPAAAGGFGNLLSVDQKAVICQLAKKAFDHQDALGLVEIEGHPDSARFSAWRRAEQLTAVGIASLTECRNSHFRTLRAHFNALLGREDKAFRDHMRTGKVKDRGPVEDTHENRETFRKKITDELMEHAGRCNPASPLFSPKVAEMVALKGGMIRPQYILGIAKQQNQGKSLDSLDAAALQRLFYTTRNRISQREGKGRTANRNKGQRGKRKASKHDFTPDER